MTRWVPRYVFEKHTGKTRPSAKELQSSSSKVFGMHNTLGAPTKRDTNLLRARHFVSLLQTAGQRIPAVTLLLSQEGAPGVPTAVPGQAGQDVVSGEIRASGKQEVCGEIDPRCS